MGTVKFADAALWKGVLKRIGDGRCCYGPVEKDGQKVLQQCDPAEAVFEGARTVDPIKSVLMPLREEVAEYGKDGVGRDFKAEPSVILAARQCDIEGLKVLDFAYLQQDVADPFYKARRESTLIVGADCTDPYETCHCTHYGTGPNVMKGADIVVSKVRDGWVLEALTEKGEKDLKLLDVKDVPESALKEREENRKRVEAELAGRVKKMGLPPVESIQDLVRDPAKESVWLEQANRCVECGACNFICCTCHCFILVDGKKAEVCTRIKNWDSCLYYGFALVAGGASPRKRRAQRLRNRFEKKFDFFQTHLEVPACDGCGRCIEACAGKIDIREVLKELADG